MTRTWRETVFILLGIALTSVMISCVTTGSENLNDRSFDSLISQADHYFELRNYQRAQLLYSSYVYSSFPNQTQIDYARYRLGLTHYLMGEYQDAYTTLSELVKSNPSYPQNPEAEEIIAKCQTKLTQAKEQLTERNNTLQQNISKVEALIEANPQDANAHYQLGDYYWEAGRYDEAVAQYKKAAELNPALMQADTIKQRVRVTQQGDFVIRNPLFEPNGPQGDIQVDAKLDRIYRSNWLGDYEAVKVSGQVKNNGLKDVRSVQVEVTIYDFYNKVQGTQTVMIGVLPAGGARAFSTVFDQITDQAIDIKKFTTQVFYE